MSKLTENDLRRKANSGVRIKSELSALFFETFLDAMSMTPEQMREKYPERYLTEVIEFYSEMHEQLKKAEAEQELAARDGKLDG